MIFIASVRYTGGVFDCDSSRLRRDCPKLSLRKKLYDSIRKSVYFLGLYAITVRGSCLR